MNRLTLCAGAGLLLGMLVCQRTPATPSTPPVAATPPAVAPASAASAADDFEASLKAWRARRLASLTGPTGWLTPVALYWLKDGVNSFGRAKGNDFVLDSAALAPQEGRFVLHEGKVSFEALPGAGISVGGQPVHTLELSSDKSGHPTELVAGSLRLTLIDRVGHLGIRVRDSLSPQRSGFHGLQYFPDRADWNIDARFEAYTPARRIRIINILAMEEDMVSPGAIVFEREGRTWRMDTILEAPGDTQLYLMFSDATSGRESYGAGRYLYLPLPQDGHVRVDFNRAFNPPCAFTAYATCPLPPPQNRLSLAVEAGELSYGHAAAGAKNSEPAASAH